MKSVGAHRGELGSLLLSAGAGSAPRVHIGDVDVEPDPHFRLFLVTRLDNPTYLPEASIMVSLVNFTITRQVCQLCRFAVHVAACVVKGRPACPAPRTSACRPNLDTSLALSTPVLQGLEEQLLADLVRAERPELEAGRDSLVASIGTDKRQLQALEARILRLLRESTTTLLDDEALIATLTNAKETSGAFVSAGAVRQWWGWVGRVLGAGFHPRVCTANLLTRPVAAFLLAPYGALAAIISSRVREAELTELQINEARDAFRHAPAVAARLWFVIANLSALHPMYTASLAAFAGMFRHCIGTAPAAATLDGRMASLVAHMHGYMHAVVCRGLMHVHKHAFAFMMAAAEPLDSGAVSAAEWQCLVRGGSDAVVSSDSSSSGDHAPPQRPDWCKAAAWSALRLAEAALPEQFGDLCAAIAGSGGSTSPWQQLLQKGGVDDFMGPAASSQGASAAASPCLLDELAAGAAGGSGLRLTAFQKLVLVKVCGVTVCASLAPAQHKRQA
jgi:dynein heavy chain